MRKNVNFSVEKSIGFSNHLNTADNQLNAKPRLSKDVRMQHFRFHKEDAININKVYLF